MNKLLALGLAALVIATVGAIGIATGIQPVQADHFHHDPDDTGHGQSFHDVTGDLHSGGIA
jgi:hypothetical protein